MKRSFVFFAFTLGIAIRLTPMADGTAKGKTHRTKHVKHHLTVPQKIVLPKIVPMQTTPKSALPKIAPAATPQNKLKHRKLAWVDIEPLVNPDAIKNLSNKQVIEKHVSLANISSSTPNVSTTPSTNKLPLNSTVTGSATKVNASENSSVFQNISKVQGRSFGSLEPRNLSIINPTKNTTVEKGKITPISVSLPTIVANKSVSKSLPTGNISKPTNASITTKDSQKPSFPNKTGETKLKDVKQLDKVTTPILGRSISKKQNASVFATPSVKTNMSAKALSNATANKVWNNFSTTQNKNISRPAQNLTAVANSKVSKGNATATAISKVGGSVLAKAQSSKGNSAATAASSGGNKNKNYTAVAIAASKGGSSKAVALRSNVGVVKEKMGKKLAPSDADELREEVDEAVDN